MVAINFSVFLDKVSDRTKTQTIRKSDRNGQIRTGVPIQLYTGMRTKDARKLVDVDPICAWVSHITITEKRLHVFRAFGCDKHYYENDDVAKQDGFDNWQDMADFFKVKYGLPFDGIAIGWHWPETKDTQ